ncbi:MAG: glycosyltransferase family 4 protein [Acholeplasmatales bacterium]|nr:glycosyltransferase family 4 protein [Acholeplasmatales bacterium]
MKVLLYFENQKALRQSGIGRALVHQKKALELAGVDYTLNFEDNDYDVVHINTLFFDSYKKLKKCKKKGLKVIVHGHSTVEDFKYSFRVWRLIAPIYNHLILRMYKKADVIITPTEYSKSLIEAYKGVNCPVYAISNGIMLDDYKYDEKMALKFDDYFKFDKNKKIVICAGLYFERKGIRDFFEIARQMPDVQFIWFGYLKPIYTQLKILKAIKHRPENVLMPGYVDIEVLRGAFMRADAFLFLSHEENEGIAVLEALASKLPVIVRDIGVFKGWLNDKVNVLKGNTIEDFKANLEYVFNNDMTEIVENAYKVVEERNLTDIGNKIKAVYESVYEEQKKC